EIRSYDFHNGRAAISFSVSQAPNVSDVAVLKGVQQALAKIRKQYPAVKIDQTFTTVTFTEKNYHSAMSALIEGSLLAVLMVWFFLRDIRATLISALAIPLATIPTFLFMQWVGFSLNQITLLALSLVSGVLVDDAIVEIENIVRHKRMGKSAFQAAIDAADQIGLAVIATSATIIAVFMPVSFMGGIIGQYFRQFGLTVAAAVFFSLLVARLLTPVIAAYALKSNGGRAERSDDGPIMSGYLRVLRWCVRHRWKTIICGTLFFAVSIGGLMLMPKSFIPDSDSSNTALHVELPPGVSLDDTKKVADEIYHIIARQPETASVDESVGDGSLNVANLYITLVPRNRRSVNQQSWQNRVLGLLKSVPDARV